MADNTPLNREDNTLLKATPPPAFKATGASVEMRALEQTLALLNNTSITGANLPPEERESAKAVMSAARSAAAPGIPSLPTQAPSPGDGAFSTPVAPVMGKVELFPKVEKPAEIDSGPTRMFAEPAITSAPAIAPPAPSAATASAPVAAGRIVLTGRTGVGKDYLATRVPGATVFNLDTPVWELIRKIFPDGAADGVLTTVQTIKAWGAGKVSTFYPISPARLVFTERARNVVHWERFGTPEFWAGLALSPSGILFHTASSRIVTGIETLAELNAFLAAGYAHYHCVCSATSYATRPKRPGADDSLSTIFDQQVTREISNNRGGRVLRCVWSDNAPAPSPRLLTAAAWGKEILSSAEKTIQTGE